MRVSDKRHRSLTMRLAQVSVWAAAFIISGMLCPHATAAGANRTLIFVIDSSERMLPYMEAVKGAVFMAADQSATGDTLGIVTSSDIAKRLVTKKTFGPRDVKSFVDRLDTIEALGEVSDVAAGVARALEELGQLRRRGDRNRKGVIVIASSQSPEENEPAETLEAALINLLRQVDEKEWYIQYCYLNGVRDGLIEKFVSSNAGITYDVDTLAAERGAEPVEELYRIFSTPQRLSLPKIIDLEGAILGKEQGGKEWAPLKQDSDVPEKMRLRVASNSRAVIWLENCGKLGLSPEAYIKVEKARQNPLTDSGRFELVVESGSIWMSLNPEWPSVLRLTTPAGTIEPSGEAAVVNFEKLTSELELSSFSDPFFVGLSARADKPLKLGRNQSLRLVGGKTREEARPVETRLLEIWKSWKHVLVGGLPLSELDFAVPEIIFPEEAIALGPMKSKEIQSRDYTIRVVGVEDLSKLEIGVDISLSLPDGLDLATGVVKGEEPGTMLLSLRADGSGGFKSGRFETHSGFLWLVPSPESKVLFGRIGVPITVDTRGPIVSSSILLGVLGTILFLIVAVVGLKAISSKSKMMSRPHAVIGRLIVVNDPTGGRVGTLNLENLSTKSSRLSLVVGRDRVSDVRLRHTSVNSAHCTIEAYLEGGRLETFIEPIDSARVTVDGEAIKSRTRLNDDAQIEIGDFIYQFEDTQMYKRVEVVRRNGRKISGIMDASGMDAEGFSFSPVDAVSPSERARVKFADIRYATFYRRVVDILSGTSRPMPKPDTMKRVELMFKKGNTISGHVLREYVEGRRRYVDLLPLETGSDIDYTVVDYSTVVEKKVL